MRKMKSSGKAGGNSDMRWYVVGHRRTGGEMHSCLMTKSEADSVYAEWSNNNYFIDVELKTKGQMV